MSSSTRKTLGVLLTPQILHMLAKVYVPVLFPLTFLVVLLGFAMDRWLGFPAQMLEPPLNWVVGGDHRNRYHLCIRLCRWIW